MWCLSEPRAGSGSLAGETLPTEPCQGLARAELRLLLSWLYFQALSGSGTDQCCMAVPMQALLHNFWLTGEIKIIPDINQLHSASGHNLNTFPWVFFPLYKSRKFTFQPSHSNSRKHFTRDCHSEGRDIAA